MTVERQFLFWGAAALALLLLLYILSGVLLPFVAAMAIAYLLDPVADRLQRLGLNRLGATVVIFVLFALILTLVFMLLAPILARQLAGFIQNFPGYLDRVHTLLTERGGALLEQYGVRVAEWLGFDYAAATADMQTGLTNAIRRALQWASGLGSTLLTGGAALLNLISLLVITPVVAFYLLLDWDKMMGSLDAYVPLRQRDAVRAIARDINAALAGFMRGQSMVCLFLGAWYGIGLSLIGLNFGFLIGFTAGLISFIPYVGSLLALVVALAVALAQGWPDWTLPALVLVVVGTGQFLESNWLTPRLVGQSVGLHPVWLIFALLAFGSLYGFTGLLIAVPVAAALGVLVRHGLARYRQSALYLGATKAGPR